MKHKTNTGGSSVPPPAREAAAGWQQSAVSFTLISGVGNYQKGTACIVSAAVAQWRLEHGKPLGEATDEMDCIDPAIRRLAIRINDASWWKDDAERTAVLSPFIPLLAGTRDESLLRKRAFLCADVAVREILPMR